MVMETLANNPRMTKNLATIFAVALATASCSHGVSRIRTHSLSAPNPTTYSFPLPSAEVHAKALEAFSIEHQLQEPVFGRSGAGPEFEHILFAECATNAALANAIFRDPANAQDVCLYTHGPFVVSSVYRGRDGGLPFMADFHLHLAGAVSDTTVTVTASDAEVINGTKFGIGSCGPGQHWNHVKVKPTTVEEYGILRYLGRSLGITNMPAVILPAP